MFAQFAYYTDSFAVALRAHLDVYTSPIDFRVTQLSIPSPPFLFSLFSHVHFKIRKVTMIAGIYRSNLLVIALCLSLENIIVVAFTKSRNLRVQTVALLSPWYWSRHLWSFHRFFRSWCLLHSFLKPNFNANTTYVNENSSLLFNNLPFF